MRLRSRCGGNVGAGDAGCKIARPLLLDPLPLPGSLMLTLLRGPASGSEKRRTGLATSTPHPPNQPLKASASLRLDYSWPYLYPRRQLLRGTRSTGVQGAQPLALFSRLNRDFFPGKKPGLNPPSPAREGGKIPVPAPLRRDPPVPAPLRRAPPSRARGATIPRPAGGVLPAPRPCRTHTPCPQIAHSFHK